MVQHALPEYLTALEEPNLEPSRRVALHLLRMVCEKRGGRFPEALNDEEARYLTLDCVSCDKPLESGRLYCGDECHDFAKTVRYVRKAMDDGRVADTDIQDAIGTRLLMLAGGGYPRKRRRLSTKRRAEIFARDGRRCKVCGAPATEIDHIDGDSNDPANLRAVCKECNGLAAWQHAHAVSPRNDPEAWHRVENLYQHLAQRIAAPKPLRCCDDPECWNVVERAIRIARQRRWRQLEEEADADFEDVDGYLYNAMQKDD